MRKSIKQKAMKGSQSESKSHSVTESPGQDQMSQKLSTRISQNGGKIKAPKPSDPVNCKLCQKWPCRYDSIKDHVKTQHSEYYDEKLPRRSWIDQTSEKNLAKNDLQKRLRYDQSESESEYSVNSSKRSKTEEAKPQVSAQNFLDQMTAILGQEEGASSQDSLTLYASLQELLIEINTASAALYLQSPEARNENSRVRQVIESGEHFMMNNDADAISGVLFASIMLAGKTLTLYQGLIKDLDTSLRTKVERKLKEMLAVFTGYDYSYADWLPKNLHRLKSNSIKFIEQNGREASELVRYSLVVDFNFNTDLKKFKNYVKAATDGMKDDKRTLLQTAIELTNDSKVSIDMQTAKDLIMQILSFPKLNPSIKNLLGAEPMNKWLALLQNQKDGAFTEDAPHLVNAAQQLYDRHQELKQHDGDLMQQYAAVQNVFKEIEMDLNHSQLATSMLAAINSSVCPRQIWIVPGGKGKSRIHGAATFYFLKYTTLDITVVFHNQGLLEADEINNKLLFDYAREANMNPDNRVHYQVGIDREGNRKGGVLLLDEIDAPMFDDLELYWKNTKAANLRVIGLTATAFDQNEEGNELKAISAMQYKLFYNSAQETNICPVVNQSIAINTLENYVKLIDEKRKTQPVLIFANDSLFGQLAELSCVFPVTKDTTAEVLASMDKKNGYNFPVMMISNDYGTRGLNFRAPTSNQGICMIIAGSFGDRRSRVQGLLRVGRFTDKCCRIQDTTYPEIDQEVNARRKGKIAATLKALENLVLKTKKVAKPIVPSPSQALEKEVTYKEAEMKEQLDAIKSIQDKTNNQ